MKKKEKKVENHLLVKAWIKFAKSKGYCIQCQYPWHDGLCECENIEHADLCNDIMKLAYKLIKEDWQ